MAPKRSSSKTRKKKTVSVKKVVRETVEVAVVVDTNHSHFTQSYDNTSSTTTTTSTVIPITEHNKTTTTKNDAVLEKKRNTKVKQKDHPTQAAVENSGVLEKKRGSKRKKKKTVFDLAQGGGRGKEEYKRYVFRVLKQVHPEMTISAKAMTVVNSMVNDMFERLAEESAKLVKYTRKMTLSSREVQAAVRLVLPGQLARHAMAEGAKAVAAYVSS